MSSNRGTAMKAYTDIRQSKNLSEILSLESADMSYIYDRHLDKLYGDVPYVIGYKKLNKDVDIPCWSLAGLFTLYPIVVGEDMGMYICWCNKHNLASRHYDNPVDSCVKMIIKLHELNLL